jgi:hypothetical protein
VKPNPTRQVTRKQRDGREENKRKAALMMPWNEKLTHGLVVGDLGHPRELVHGTSGTAEQDGQIHAVLTPGVDLDGDGQPARVLKMLDDLEHGHALTDSQVVWLAVSNHMLDIQMSDKKVER